MQLSYRTEERSRTLLFYLCQTLEGVPFGAIKTCEECGNWFLHISKREKIYCSHKCGNIKANRDRRNKMKIEDPKKYEAELSAGAKRSRKSYVRKVKKVHPKAKPERRPIKYKD